MNMPDRERMTTVDDQLAAELRALSKILDDPPVTTVELPNGWQRTELRGPYADFIEHCGGVPWHERSLPPRWHRCRATTRTCTALAVVERCACGGTRGPDYRHWVSKNARRR